MKPGQYIPFSFKIGSVDLIVYPVKDENPIRDIFADEDDIKQHLEKLYSKNNLAEGRYHIVFVWNLDGKRMTDVWVHKLENWSAGCGPLLEVKVFEDLEESDSAGIASGDSIMTLGREEELRRKTNTLEEYLDRSKHMPDFVEGFTPDEKF
ncbi:hypothetical protein JW710_02410 [Candidatus Dojkabacteria bacterium]|nr:hypothetical protein [Candidatus Dojkabacteria bacterium]